MLTFAPPYYDLEGIIVFRDHAVPTHFHYLCGAPHLSRDEADRPNLLLLKYRDPIAVAAARPQSAGGGFLLFGVDCGIDEGVKDRLRGKLQALMPPDAGAISLSPVLYRDGSVKVLALDHKAGEENASDGDGFVRDVLGTAVPSLMQDQRAIFAVSLSSRGVTLVEEAFETNLSPIGVMYELEFSGLRPALSAKAVVHMEKVYDSLSVELKAGYSSGSGAAATPATTTPAATTPAATPHAATTPAATTPAATTPAATTPAATTPAAPTPAAPTPAATTPAATTPAATTPAAPTTPAATTTTPAATTTTTPAATTPAASTGTGVDVGVKLGLLIEHLKQTGAIEIEIIRESEEADVVALEQRALQLVQDVIIGDLFKPVMSTNPADQAIAGIQQAVAAGTTQTSQGTTGSGGKVKIGLELQYKKKEELQERRLDLRETAPEKRKHAPNAFFSALLSRTERDKHIRTIDLDDPFFRLLEVNVVPPGNLAALDIEAVLAEVQYGGTVESPAVSNTSVFRGTESAPQRFQAPWDRGDGRWRYRLDYRFAAAASSSEIAGQKTAWRDSTGSVLYLHPSDDLRLLTVVAQTGFVAWSAVERIRTRVQWKNPATGFHTGREWLFASTTQPQTWSVHLPEGASDSYEVQHTWILVGGSEIHGEAFTTSARDLYIEDPFQDSLVISVDPLVDPAKVLRISVDITYSDPPSGYEARRRVDLTTPYTPRTVEIPLIRSGERGYRYEVSLIKAGGAVERWDPRESDGGSILVTEGGVYLDVEVLRIGDLNTLGLDAVQIDFRVEPLEGQTAHEESLVLLPGEDARKTVRLLVRADRPAAYEYRVTLFKKSGDIVEKDWVQDNRTKRPLPLASLLAPQP